MSKYYDVDSKVSKMMKFLEVVKKKLSFLWCYSENDQDSKLSVSTPQPIPHHLIPTTQPSSFTLSPCPMCNRFFHCNDTVTGFCKCMYHPWCLGFVLQTFQVCGKSTCGEKFDFEWCTSVGFMLGNLAKPKLHP
jgi:hypothetical protein